MRADLDKPPPNARIAALAGRQHGVVTRSQLKALGLDRNAIQRRVRAGHLHRIHHNVYAVGHRRLSQHGRFLSAVLSFGGQAVLSHGSAAILWRIRPEREARVHVTVPRGGGRGARMGVVLHRSPIGGRDAASRDGIPVTTPARTIVDLADHLTRRELERAIDEAIYLRLDLTSVQPLPGRRGSGLLAEVLADHAPGTTRTKSEFEEFLFALCRRHDLPQPLVNQVVEGFEVDFVWPEARLIVEADSWSAHSRRSAFERDRVRDAALQLAGFRVIRITWRRLVAEPELIARQLARLMERDAAP
jgi:very-short-patch-repair endonuclease